LVDSAQTVKEIMSALIARRALGSAGLIPAVLACLTERDASMTIADLSRELQQPSQLLAHCIAQLLQAHILERGVGYDEVRMSRFGRELLCAAASASPARCRSIHLAEASCP
jgi:hypothetical protein